MLLAALPSDLLLHAFSMLSGLDRCCGLLRRPPRRAHLPLVAPPPLEAAAAARQRLESEAPRCSLLEPAASFPMYHAGHFSLSLQGLGPADVQGLVCSAQLCAAPHAYGFAQGLLPSSSSA